MPSNREIVRKKFLDEISKLITQDDTITTKTTQIETNNENDKRIHIEDNASMSFIKSQELDITNSSFTNENLLKPDFTIINKNKLLKIGKEKNYLTYKQSNKTYDKEPNFYYYKR